MCGLYAELLLLWDRALTNYSKMKNHISYNCFISEYYIVGIIFVRQYTFEFNSSTLQQIISNKTHYETLALKRTPWKVIVPTGNADYDIRGNTIHYPV